jgi:hypothetical protein
MARSVLTNVMDVEFGRADGIYNFIDNTVEAGSVSFKRYRRYDESLPTGKQKLSIFV